jgi:hypothetical protein
MKTFRTPFTLIAGIAAAATIGSATPALAANLLVNGDFELPQPSEDSFIVFGAGASFPGWTVMGANKTNAVQLLSSDYSEVNIRFNAESGFASMDLSGGGNAGPKSGISQAVATQIGQAYDLSFWIGNADGTHNGNYALPSTVGLQINDGPLLTYTNSAISPGRTDWLLVGASFVATGNQTRISFFNETPLADAETGLDNVTLSAAPSAAPEPDSWALMILGFGGAGLLLRRHRRSGSSPWLSRGSR